MNETYVFEGTLTAVEPLTVIIKGASSSVAHRLPRNGGADAPAYWPATTIRGSLRHAAHRVALGYNEDTQQPAFDLADHFMLAQGVDIVGDIKKPADGEIDGDRLLREGNPLISLFGLWGLPSRACIGNAFPLTPNASAMFGGGARTVMFERSPELLEVLDEAEQCRLQVILDEQAAASLDITELKDKQKELKKQLKNASDEDKKAIFAEISKLDALIAERKDAKSEARESIRRPIDQYEAIVAGTDMQHRMSLKGASTLELGFFIATLLEFARSPKMGGHLAHNCGTVSGEWEVKTWARNEMEPKAIGKVAFDSTGFRLEGDVLNSAYKEWSEHTNINFHKKRS